MGGQWTAEFKKTEADAACMPARNGAKFWCAKYAFAKQESFYFTRYGVEACNMLAREWACRAEYYVQLWYSDGEEEEFAYTE